MINEADLELATGILDTLPEGYGFLRTSNYLPTQEDVYVSLSQVRRFQLRRGDEIVGMARKPKESEKYQALVRIDTINGKAPADILGRPWFDKLTPLYPEERIRMEVTDQPNEIAQRIIDLVAPIGKGQRGMIVSPPKAGKTTVMKQIANSIRANSPDGHLIVLLVDERPEEVTDMQRSVDGEIVYSTFDRPSDDHIQVTELTLDRAKRMVELGRDVVILLDGITRLSRAYNLATPASGRILSGGVDSTALYPPKRFFGAARNIEQGGSLTIIATALVETGSRMDEVIFEEFKGTGNWELKLDRRASEKRLFPAIDISSSGTRKEELLLTKEELNLVWKLRRVLHALDSGAGLELAHRQDALHQGQPAVPDGGLQAEPRRLTQLRTLIFVLFGVCTLFAILATFKTMGKASKGYDKAKQRRIDSGPQTPCPVCRSSMKLVGRAGVPVERQGDRHGQGRGAGPGGRRAGSAGRGVPLPDLQEPAAFPSPLRRVESRAWESR